MKPSHVRTADHQLVAMGNKALISPFCFVTDHGHKSSRLTGITNTKKQKQGKHKSASRLWQHKWSLPS